MRRNEADRNALFTLIPFHRISRPGLISWRHRLAACTLASLVAGAAMPAGALETWADPKLPVQDGLALWLDASRLAAARSALRLPAPDATLEVWPDGSGHRRDARQPEASRRPAVVESDAGTTVKFDGADDVLFGDGAPEAKSATVFVVLAPQSNAGGFRVPVSFRARGQADLASGMTLDLGPAAATRFDFVNIEGAGAGGKRNLLMTRFDFGTFHVLSVITSAEGAHLQVNGTPEGNRARRAGVAGIADYALGARRIPGEQAAPRAHGFFHGDLAEVIVFDRELTRAERSEVENYLQAKHQRLRALKPAPARDAGKPLERVENPPLVQWLSPGFESRELPLRLPNINFVRYRHDGVLVAGGYNGKIWLLRDTDGDGLEDTAAIYYESPTIETVMGMALTPRGDPRGFGVFVASAGRVLFVPDRDGDDRGDTEVVVASGWTRMRRGPPTSDSIGLAVGPDGDVWFSLGTSDFVSAYLVDEKTGMAGYRVDGDRGTIQRVSADFKTRTTVSTGIRFAYGMAFNARGDLFATDQEGATWLPNGNVFDELLHIQPHRHYGFPPRHPQFLPGVLDEPSVFDFAPQHQCTCGFFFNEPLGNRPVFGPDWWRGDAFVTGASRGKLWRVKLAHSPTGYVAQSQLVAALQMILIDAALSPDGEMVLSCHSGAPDWGSGPNGIGTLFKVRRTAPLPQPVVAWAASPTELRVAFDQPLSAENVRGLEAVADVTAGRYVAAADRYERVRPGYQVVQDQLGTSRSDVPVRGAELSADGRTLRLRVEPQTVQDNLALILAGLHGRDATAVDVQTNLNGLTAEWQGADGAAWSGWLPHPDLAVARELTTGSAEHEALWRHLARPGRLALRGQLDLWRMLRPPIQAGARLDYAYLPETVSVVFSSAAPFRLTAGGRDVAVSAGADRHQAVAVLDTSRAGDWLAFELVAESGAPNLSVHWFTAEDPRPRAFPLQRVLVPWAEPPAGGAEAVAAEEERDIPELVGGNWLRGRELFRGKAACATCHDPVNHGFNVGPDLASMQLAQRDYAGVVRDIREPSGAINPDYIAYSVELADGTALAGVLKGENNGVLHFATPAGRREVPRSGLKAMEALPISLMPPGLLEALTPEEQRDLLTYLLQPAIEPAPILLPNPPRPRPHAEVQAVLQANPAAHAGGTAAAPLRILLCADSTGSHIKPGRHDYPLWRKRWARLLGLAENVTVETAESWPTPEQWARNDLVVLYSNNDVWAREKDPTRVEALGRDLDGFLARGGGLVVLHFSLNGGVNAQALASRIGLAWPGPAGKFRHNANDWKLVPEHPLAIGFTSFDLPDESYWNLSGDLTAADARVLGTSTEEGSVTPQWWTREVGQGRVFVSIPGHYTWTFDDPLYRVLTFRGMMWAARQPIDRLAPLATVGARVVE